jgi:hypothetical protein
MNDVLRQRLRPVLLVLGVLALVLASSAGGTPARVHARADAGLSWTLASDFAVAPNERNPNPDSSGNPGVWRFLAGPVLRVPSTYVLLHTFDPATSGIQGLDSWHGYGDYDTPKVAVNASGADQTVPNFVWPAGAAIVHPFSGAAAVVDWRSPIAGKVHITASFADLDSSCGDGIGWFLDQGKKKLASGRIQNGGGPQTASVDRQVQVGTNLYAIVDNGGSGDYYCDTTQLDLTIQTVN